MSALRAVLGGAAGAAAYNAYQESESSSLGGMASSLFDAFQRKGASQMAEVARAQKQVEELQSALIRSLRERGGQTVVIKEPGRGGTLAIGVVVLVGGALVYLRFVKGYKLADMMYVTQGALASMQESVSTSLASVKGQVEAATSDMLSRLGVVASKADEVLGRQEAMEGKLGDVEGRVAEVHGGVEMLQHQVAYTNSAVTMLCGAMSEIAKRVGLGGGRYTSRLEGFVHGAEEASGRAQMLGGGAAAPRVGGGDGRPLIVGPGPDGLPVIDATAAAASAATFVADWAQAPPSPPAPPPRPNPAVYVFNGVADGGAMAAARAAKDPGWGK